MCMVSATPKPQDKWLTVVPITTPKCTLTVGSPRARGALSSSHHTLCPEHQQAMGCPSFPVSLSYTNLPFLSSALCSLGYLGPLTLLSCPCPFSSSYSTPRPTSLLSWPGTLSYIDDKIFLLSHTCGHVLVSFMWQWQCFACLIMDTNSWHDVLARFLSL